MTIRPLAVIVAYWEEVVNFEIDAEILEPVYFEVVS